MSTQKRPGLLWAWAVLIVAAANQLLWNLWHAYASGMPRPLALALGAMPVLLAIGTSALATRVRGGWVLRTLTYGVMLSAIGLSILAQYDLLMHWTQSRMVAVLFPAVGDLAVLIALHTLITEPRAERAAAPSMAVPEAVPVGAPAVDAEPVPVYAGAPAPVPVVSLERSTPDVPAAPVLPVPVQTAGPEQSVPVAEPVCEPSVQTAPPQTATPVPDRSEPSVQTGDVPVLTSKKDGDEDAIEQLRTAFADTDPAEVTIGMVRRELGGAGFARGKRLHGLWVRTATADRSADRSMDRSAAEPSTAAMDRDEDGTDSEREPDRTADRATVPA